MTATPHVFVIHGDITRLACDAWLLPTDRTLNIGDHWRKSVPQLGEQLAGLDALNARFADETTVAEPIPGWPEDEPVPVLTAVPFFGSTTYDAELEKRVKTGLEKAVATVCESGRVRRSALPLIALPLVGTAGGGADPQRGAVIEGILRTARTVARLHEVDIVLVLSNPVDLALAQRARRRDPKAWVALPTELRSVVSDLASKALRGSLVPFMGAGVSHSAGLPLWGELVALLRQRVDIKAELLGPFDQLGVLDQAVVLRQLFDEAGQNFREEVARCSTGKRYGLAPALLAGLPTREAVTLNYDQLYEFASDDVGRPVNVLPGQTASADERWLLKLHGSVTDHDSIVLTREDYLSYSRGRAALSSLAKAMLITRHLLFVGFGFQDDHFHELMHEVREVFPHERRGDTRFGTALMLGADPLQARLWGKDVHFVPMPVDGPKEQGRMLEILLDRVLAESSTSAGFFFDRRYEHVLDPAEVQLRDRLLDLVSSVTDGEGRTAAWSEVEGVLISLGLPGKRAR